jgi:hypothetical protein
MCRDEFRRRAILMIVPNTADAVRFAGRCRHKAINHRFHSIGVRDHISDLVLCCMRPQCGGGLNRSTQHFIFREKMECGDGSEISQRVYSSREGGIMGPLEARGVAEGDRPSFWQAVIVYLFPGGTAWRDSSCPAASLQAGIDAGGTRGDFQRDYGPSISTIDRQGTWPLTLDGEPGNEPQWRL